MPLPPTDNLTIGEVMHRLSSLTPQDFVGEVNDLRERYKKLPLFVLPLDYVGDLAQAQAGLGAGFLYDQTSPPNNGNQTPVIDCSAFSSLGVFPLPNFLVIQSGAAGVGNTCRLIVYGRR